MRAVLDYTAIAFDILGFFFVTIDLYGEKRLLELQDRLKGVKLGDGGDAIIHLVFHRQKFLLLCSFLISIPTLYLLGRINFRAWFYFDALGFVNNILYFILRLALDFGLSILFFILLYSLVGILANMVFHIVRFLQRQQIKHFMILIGAAFFIAGKIISIWRVQHG